MTEIQASLSEEYCRVLDNYLGGGGETALRWAYELGRHALESGVGVLDVLAVHEATVSRLAASRKPFPPAGLRLLPVLAECLSPFEMVLRGFRETNARLRQSMAELSMSEAALRRQNEELTSAHAEVESARRRYQRLFEFAPDGYLVTDSEAVVREANTAAAGLLNTPAALLKGESLAEFLTPAHRDEFHRQLLLFRSGATVRRDDWQVRIQPAGRQEIPVFLTAEAESASGHDTGLGLRWLLRDATGQRRAEEERAQSLMDRAEAEGARRVAFLAEASSLLAGSLDDESKLARVARLTVPYLADWCLMHVTDPSGDLMQFEIAHGDSRDSDLAGQIKRFPLRFWPAPHSAGVFSGPAEVWPAHFAGANEPPQTGLPPGISSIMVVPLSSHDQQIGALTLISVGSGRRYSAGELALAQELGRRCSLAIENTRLYREVIRERDIAARASRAKDEFLAVLSHELRNPLMPVVGWTRILGNSEKIREDPDLAEGVRALERNAEILNRLVGDCLDLARISDARAGRSRMTIRKETVDLNGVLAACAASIRDKAEAKRLNLAVELSGNPLWVIGDNVRLQQVVMNLLVNAVKYTPAGGSVSLISTRADGQAIVEVHDSGAGIEPDALERIFDPFYRGSDYLSTTESGLGLGLAIAKRLVEQHDGRIFAQSGGHGAGSVFRMTLPLAPVPQAAARPDDTSRSAERAGTALRVLIVEDAPDVLFLLKKELGRMGYSIQDASNGRDALAMAHRTPPDVIVSDIRMPGMNGFELLQLVRADAELRHIPAIALTGFGQKSDIQRALTAGFDSCLAKPAEIEDLDSCIRQVVRQRTGEERQNKPQIIG